MSRELELLESIAARLDAASPGEKNGPGGVLEEMAERLESLLAKVATLEARLRSLETGAVAAAPSSGPSEEIVMVVAAAAAAFLGKRPKIRQIRLIGSTAWAQQGRVSIQASHGLPVQHS